MNLTAIIACKDRKQNLDYCLASIHMCNPQPFCIVVDYDSTIPLSYPQYPWLKIIRINNSNGLFHKSLALNIALHYVNTRFICCTDADQVFNPNFFGLVYNHLCKQKNIIVMCKTYLLKNLHKVKPNDILTNNGYNRLLVAAQKEHQKRIGEGCCIGLSLDWITSVNGWDENYIGWGYEDTDLLFRAELAGLKRCYIDHKTNMIHLPHSRVGKYYNNTNGVRNKRRLIQKQASKIPKNKLIRADNKTAWGKFT